MNGTDKLRSIPGSLNYTMATISLLVIAGLGGVPRSYGSENAGTQKAASVSPDDGFSVLMAYQTGIAASAQYLTLNKEWGIDTIGGHTIAWWGKAGYQTPLSDGSYKIKVFTQTLKEYWDRNSECRQDANTPTKCYTILKHKNWGVGEEIAGCATHPSYKPEFDTLRYGYYCGAGHPSQDVTAFNYPKQPLDPVDYCCRLHDDGAWADDAVGMACGMKLCLKNAAATPGLSKTAMGETERARQCWYDMADTICPSGGTLAAPAPARYLDAPIRNPNPPPPFPVPAPEP